MGGVRIGQSQTLLLITAFLHSQGPCIVSTFFCCFCGEERKINRGHLGPGRLCLLETFVFLSVLAQNSEKLSLPNVTEGFLFILNIFFLACCSEMLLETFYKLGNGRIFQKCKLFDSLALSTKSLSCLTHPVTDKQDLCVDLK